MRRDQVEAQSYLTSRLAAALVRADPDAIESPNRRDIRALIASVLAGAVAVAVVVVVNLLMPEHSLAWRKADQLIVDKGTGSRYLLVDNQLRPVQNLASARLYTGKALTVTSVSSSTLRSVPRGAPIGSVGLPDALPQATLLNQGAWQVCAISPTDAGKTGPQLVVRIGGSPATAKAGTGVLVTENGTESVIYGGYRHQLAGPWVADVLGFGSVRPAPVASSWLDLFPDGGSLAPIAIDNAGTSGPLVGPRHGVIGALYTMAGSQSHYVLLADGLAPLTGLQYLLQSSAKSAVTIALTAKTLAHTARSRTIPAAPKGWPDGSPTLTGQSADQLVCLQWATGASSAPASVVYLDPPTGAHPVSGTSVPTAVAVTPGGGALIAATEPTRQNFTDVTLISDAGEAYPIPNTDSLQALGYSLDQVSVLPDEFRDLLPQGVPLAKTS